MNGFSINWLWVVGSVVAVYLIVAAMGRRQSRLTDVLKEHVRRHNEPVEPPRSEQENAE